MAETAPVDLFGNMVALPDDMSFISVHDEPFQNSVAPVAPGVPPPKTIPELVFPVPLAATLAVLISVVSVQEVPSQDSTALLNAGAGVNPPATKPDTGFFTGGGLNDKKNPYEITVGKDKEDLTWLLG